MAFTTEFVMGAGGSVEEIPVSMSGGGGTASSPTVYPLATVDAGAGALIAVGGTLTPGTTSSAYEPQLTVGGLTFASPRLLLTGPDASPRPGGLLTGTVQIAILSRTSGTTTFTGTVYVVRL